MLKQVQHDNIFSLAPRVLCWVAYSSWLVVADFVYCYADVLEYFEELFAEVAECNCTVVWEVLFDKYVAVEAALCKAAGGRCSIAER